MISCSGACRWGLLLKPMLGSERRYTSSLVRDRSAGGTGAVDYFEALEADFTAPFLEISGGTIEGIAESNKNV